MGLLSKHSQGGEMFKISIIFLALIFSTSSFAKLKFTNNILAVGQGISSPSMTSTVNFTSGWSYENPVGAVYQNRTRVSGQFATTASDSTTATTSSSTYGGEFGMGTKSFGFALGYSQSDCTNCESSFGGAVAGIFNTFALGAGYHENVTSVGVIFSPMGNHRIGLTADINEGVTTTQVLGAGYSYVGQNFRLALDVSKRFFDSVLLDDDPILITPGLVLQVSKALAITLSYDKTINESTTTTTTTTTTTSSGSLWYGIGFTGGENWHIAAYGEYVGDWSLTASYFF